MYRQSAVKVCYVVFHFTSTLLISILYGSAVRIKFGECWMCVSHNFTTTMAFACELPPNGSEHLPQPQHFDLVSTRKESASSSLTGLGLRPLRTCQKPVVRHHKFEAVCCNSGQRKWRERNTIFVVLRMRGRIRNNSNACVCERSCEVGGTFTVLTEVVTLCMYHGVTNETFKQDDIQTYCESCGHTFMM